MDAEYQRHEGTSAKGIVDELVDVYAKVYDVPPYIGDPFFSADSFRTRLEAAFDSERFETVTAQQNGRIVGYVHGATLPTDKPWWGSLGNQRPADLRELAEAGGIFWLRELMVLPELQNQGLGRQIHETVIAGRPESVTTLTCIIDNQPAHDAYLRWGYTIMGQIKHAPESPFYDASICPPAESGTHMTQTITKHHPVPETYGRRDRLSQGPDMLFCYGTLQFDAVLEALLGRIPERATASAPGYRAAALTGRVYPGLVVRPFGGSAPGVVLTDLSNEEWRILDAFEDERYELQEVALSTGKRGWAYVWPGGDIRPDDWDAEEFQTRHLEEYAARCARLAPGLAAGLPKGE